MKFGELAERPINVLDANCPSRRVLSLIAGKWAVLTIHALSHGTKRYSELQRMIGGVSQKMLTQTLRELEQEGLVERKVYPIVPPMVEYSLTPLGQTLQEPLGAICTWAESHLSELEAHRTSSSAAPSEN